ncbi:MAG: TetR/AcrR family transcriptional regulator [Flavobacteriaceae bacterium]
MPRVETFDREEVLNQSMQLFWEKGYHGTSMQELVDATGLNRSSIYNSFGSKLELYQASLTHYQKASGGCFQNALMKADNPLQALRLIFENFLEVILEDEEGKGCFVMNCKAEMANKDDKLQKWLLDHQAGALALFEDLIKDGQEQGVINSREDSMSYAYYMLNAFQGFRMTGILIRDRKILQHIIDNSINVLM